MGYVEYVLLWNLLAERGGSYLIYKVIRLGMCERNGNEHKFG